MLEVIETFDNTFEKTYKLFGKLLKAKKQATERRVFSVSSGIIRLADVSFELKSPHNMTPEEPKTQITSSVDSEQKSVVITGFFERVKPKRPPVRVVYHADVTLFAILSEPQRLQHSIESEIDLQVSLKRVRVNVPRDIQPRQFFTVSEALSENSELAGYEFRGFSGDAQGLEMNHDKQLDRLEVRALAPLEQLGDQERIALFTRPQEGGQDELTV